MSAVMADTHAIVWYLSKPEKLSQTAIQILDRASQSGQMIYLSAISIVELQYLTERNRIDPLVLTHILQNVRSVTPSIEIADLDIEIGDQLIQTDRTIVPEMPDRIIATTALVLNLPLVTCDHKIQACSAIQTVW
jgi:PIN domain nuclease of toxin-antitoxin system